MGIRRKDCPTSRERARSSYRPSWYVLLALALVLFSLIRVAVGADWDVMLVPVAALAFAGLVDLALR